MTPPSITSFSITPIDSPLHLERKIKTIDEALDELENCPFAFLDTSPNTGTNHSKVFILYSASRESTLQSAHHYMGTIHIPRTRDATLVFDSQTGKFSLKTPSMPEVLPKYDTLFDLISQHPLTSPHAVFDQRLVTDSIIVHPIGGTMTPAFF